MAFADDLLARAIKPKQAEEIIEAYGRLDDYGLELNKGKSQILKVPSCLDGKDEFSRIYITSKVKYLWYQLSPLDFSYSVMSIS